MTLNLPDNHDTVEFNGCSFETLVPKIITLPKKNIIEKIKYFIRRLSPILPFHSPSPGVSVQFGIGIKNHTSKPLHFQFTGFLLPEIFRENQLILWRGFSLRPEAGLWDLRLINPGERTVFFRDLNLFWLRGNQYGLSLLVNGASYFISASLKPGKYQVRFTYQNDRERISHYDPFTKAPILIEDFWVGQVSTPLVEIELVKPSKIYQFH